MMTTMTTIDQRCVTLTWFLSPSLSLARTLSLTHARSLSFSLFSSVPFFPSLLCVLTSTGTGTGTNQHVLTCLPPIEYETNVCVCAYVCLTIYSLAIVDQPNAKNLLLFLFKESHC